MGELSPISEEDDYEVGPEGQCVMHYLYDYGIEDVAYVCKDNVGSQVCYAIAVNRGGIICLDGTCQSLNSNNSAMHITN